MFYVYILRSAVAPTQTYTGVTADLKKRLADHNSGNSVHTSKYLPWEIVFYAAFVDKQVAYSFEKYLKTHSGRAFANKRFMNASELPK